ncbi:hypothetical protein ACHAWF_017092 [Thalassiosira exigua]
MDDVALDDERHRREESERRVRRHRNRESKSRPGRQESEKERKRREHARRILDAQGGAKKKGGSKPPPPGGKGKDSAGGSSAFRALFDERAEGFFVDLRFRNAPPRPPVGPTFVGLGLEGELTDKWTRYKARNAVERQYAWKLHPEEDGGVPLAGCAMDFEGCYSDPAKKDSEVDDGARGGEGGDKGKPSKPDVVIPALHPDDEALIDWKGSKGDTAAERLQQRQDRARAAARLAVARGHGAPVPPKGAPGSSAAANAAGGTPGASSASGPRLKQHHLKSRILDERTPHFMKKTTYLTNDATSVHRFKSLAETQRQKAKDVDRELAETKRKYAETGAIDKGFKEVNEFDVIDVGGEKVSDEENEGAAKKKRRTHPTKKGVHAVWDLPLLPDASTWGHVFAHVVQDTPPKVGGSNNDNTKGKSPAKKKDGKDGEEEGAAKWFRPAHLGKGAVVADVARRAGASQMACTQWVPEPPKAVSDAEDAEKSDKEGEKEKGGKKESKRGKPYRALARYALDVLPLRDAKAPPSTFVWIVDPSKSYVGYHVVGSRVQLSTGRPMALRGSKRGADDEVMDTDRSYVRRREMDEKERGEWEEKRKEVDAEPAEGGPGKDAGGSRGAGGGVGGGRVGGGAKWTPADAGSDSDSDEEEAGDAF